MSFSEAVNQAEIAIQNYLKRVQIPSRDINAIKKVFLDGFKGGWQHVEQHGISKEYWEYHLNALREDLYQGYIRLSSNVPKMAGFFIGFGNALGTVMAALEFHGKKFISIKSGVFRIFSGNLEILKVLKLYKRVLGTLRDKPEFLTMVETKVRIVKRIV